MAQIQERFARIARHNAPTGQPRPPTLQKVGSTAARDLGCMSCATDDDPFSDGIGEPIEPWAGWRLVLAWALAWCLAGFALAATVTGLYQLIVWVGGL